MGRQPSIMIVTGMPGVGKSYQTKKDIEVYIQPDGKVSRPGRKVLIFDTNDEYKDYRSVRYNVKDPSDNGKHISMLTNIEIRRILPYWPDAMGNKQMMGFADKEKTLIDLIKSYRNGLVLLEDINTYLLSAKSVETISMLCSSRHRGTDLMIQLQSMSAIDPRMWQNCTFIRMHYQTDDVTRYKSRLNENFEPLKIAQNIINAEYHAGNIRFFLYFHNHKKKIMGCTEKQYMDALDIYKEDHGSSSTLNRNPFMYLDK